MMNIENKKQFASISLAIGLGLVATFLTSHYVQSSIKGQAKDMAKDYQKKNAALIGELELVKKQMRQVVAQQEDLRKKQEQQQMMVANLPSQPGGPGGKAPKKDPVVEMNSFSVKTPPGKRALTIMIDSLSAVGGLISPGDFVDVLSHLEVPGRGVDTSETDTVTTILFQNIQVLAVGTNFQMAGKAPQYEAQSKTRSLNITLALTPEEVGLMSFAQQNGQLQLSLRAPAEKETWNLQVASWESLADFVLEHQGTELMLPKQKKPVITSIDEETEEGKPFIQIFRGGREL
ncbi:MAG: Flp pilus assembly protein CpaB [Candidatus Omnitrophica bacterium]|nr:Flp pilus assembly protein CpaB [Candidatus Omnitrophota bacterium]